MKYLLLLAALITCSCSTTYDPSPAKPRSPHAVISKAEDIPQKTYGRITVKTIELNQDENVKHFQSYAAAKEYFKFLVRKKPNGNNWLGQPIESTRVVMFDQGYLLIQTDAPAKGFDEKALDKSIFKSTDGWYYRSDKLMFEKENGPFKDRFEAWAHGLEYFEK